MPPVRPSIKSVLVLVALAVTGSLATALAACGGPSETGCGGLSSCCSMLSGTLAQTCQTALTASEGVDEACTDVLTGYQSSGLCSGGAGTGCSGLSACCPSLPVGEDPTECNEVAGNGTDEACDESLATYRSAGYCGGGGVFELDGDTISIGDAAVLPPVVPDGATGGGEENDTMEASLGYGECSPCFEDGGGCGLWDDGYACVQDPKNGSYYCAYGLPDPTASCPAGTNNVCIPDPTGCTGVCYPKNGTCAGWMGGH